MTRKFSILALSVAALALASCGDKKAADANKVASGPITPIAAPNGGDWSETVSQTAEGGFVMGNPEAPVKLVEFGSLTCSHCREFDEAAMTPLVDTYVKSGQVSFEFRNFVRDGLDLTASVIARCGGPSSFFGLTRQIYAEQPKIFEQMQKADPAQLQALDTLPPAQKLPRFAELAGLKQFAAQRGIPAAKADQCLSNQAEVDKLVQMQSDTAAAYQFPGTPSFLINGDLVEIENGTPVWTQIEAKLRAAIRG